VNPKDPAGPTLGDGRFRLVAPLGVRQRGGAFLAVDNRTGAECALKVLDDDTVPTESVQRFEAEAKALQRLSHPHLVRAHANGREGGLSWYAMDLLPGGNLQDLLKNRGALPAPIALSLVFQVLLGLDALHRDGLVHRDVKLTNVLLDGQQRAVVTDLGVAHHPKHQVQFQTETGQGLGTEGYTAPEQWEHAARVGPPADLFATGVLLYRLLTRKPPHRLHLAQIRPELLSDHPEALRTLLLHSTRLEPGDRPADARTMGAEVATAATAMGVATGGWMRLFDAPGPPDPWDPVRAWLRGGPAS